MNRSPKTASSALCALLVLALAAPAAAQDQPLPPEAPPPPAPAPAKPAPKPARAKPAPKPAPAQPTEPVAEAPAAASDDAETQPAEAQPAEARPAPAEQPAEGEQPAAAEGQPAEEQPAEAPTEAVEPTHGAQSETPAPETPAPSEARPAPPPPPPDPDGDAHEASIVVSFGGRDVLDYEEGDVVPAGYFKDRRMRKGLVIGGAVTLGLTWLASCGAAAYVIWNDRKDQEPMVDGFDNVPAEAALAIPLAGPFVAIETTRPNPAGMALLVADGVIQVGALTMLITGLAAKETVLVREEGTEVALTPSAGPGFGAMALTGTF